jgi:hypothetical protein
MTDDIVGPILFTPHIFGISKGFILTNNNLKAERDPYDF